jgi:hypothetical protein
MASYNESIVRLIKQFLDNDGWHYEFHEDTGIFTFGVNLDSKLQSAKYVLAVRDDRYTVYAVCPMSATDCKAAMAEFITRANYGLPNGNFELDFRDGEIRYKTFVSCLETVPGKAVIEESIVVPALMLDRYADGILAVMFGMKTPEEAVRDCEE